MTAKPRIAESRTNPNEERQFPILVLGFFVKDTRRWDDDFEFPDTRQNSIFFFFCFLASFFWHLRGEKETKRRIIDLMARRQSEDISDMKRKLDQNNIPAASADSDDEVESGSSGVESENEEPQQQEEQKEVSTDKKTDKTQTKEKKQKKDKKEKKKKKEKKEKKEQNGKQNQQDQQDKQNTPIANFDSLNLDPRLLQALTAQKFVKPTLVQAEAIPLALEGKDVFGMLMLEEEIAKDFFGLING